MGDPPVSFASIGAPGEDPFELEGDLVDGQYRVETLVGEGELSVVYRGIHEGVNAPIAIKCLNLPQTLEPKLVQPISESFREGARVHYRLARGHLHIVQTLACGDTLAPRTGQLVPYIVREWLDGRSLAADFAARVSGTLRARTPAEAVELLESAADAIAYAQAEGVMHHSLSPSNLFLAKTRAGEVLKVLDFGMARPAVALGNPGLRLLLSSYAAPEQLDRRIGEPSASTDVFAFALVLFEAIAGRPYFPASSHPSEVLRIAEAREPLAKGATHIALPRELESVLSRALAPRPRERHADLRAFWADVKRAVRPASSLRPAPVPPRVTPPPIPRPVLADLAPRSTPSSWTGEVAPPVTTSAVFPAAPDVATAPTDLAEPCDANDRPTTPVPPLEFLALHGLAGAPPPVARARLAAVVAAALMTVIVVAASLGRARPSVAPRAAGREARTLRAVAHVPTVLLLSETRSAPRHFDRAATVRALDEAAAGLEACTRPGSPRGPGSIRVLISPSGQITSLQIGPPYAGTATGQCIRNRFLAAPLPSFAGSLQALNYVFVTIPFN